MEPQKVDIPRSVGGVLKGLLYSTGNPRNSTRFVIICHGFTGDKLEWGRFPATAEALNNAGFDAVIFDFSGSGENVREPITLFKQVQDLEDVFAWVKAKGYPSISTIGLSFGGITSLFANLPDRKCAVFWAPAFYMKKIVGPVKIFLARLLSKIKKTPISIKSSGDHAPILTDYTFMDALQKADPDEKLRKFTLPSLIIQGTLDKAVKPENTRVAYSLMPQDDHHKLIEIEGTDHDFNGKYLDMFIEHSIIWLKRYA
jgi:esterase/lipase